MPRSRESDQYAGSEQRYSQSLTRVSFAQRYIERPGFDLVIPAEVRENPDLTLVEAGCGPGPGGSMGYLISRRVGVREENITGIDNNPTIVELARSNFPQARIIHGDITARSARKYDIVKADVLLCTMVLHHLGPREYARAIGNFAHWIKDDGIILILMPHPYFSRLKYPIPEEDGSIPILSEEFIMRAYNRYLVDGWERRTTRWGEVNHYHRRMADIINPITVNNKLRVYPQDLFVTRKGLAAGSEEELDHYGVGPVRLLLHIIKNNPSAFRKQQRAITRFRRYRRNLSSYYGATYVTEDVNVYEASGNPAPK